MSRKTFFFFIALHHPYFLFFNLQNTPGFDKIFPFYDLSLTRPVKKKKPFSFSLPFFFKTRMKTKKNTKPKRRGKKKLFTKEKKSQRKSKSIPLHITSATTRVINDIRGQTLSLKNDIRKLQHFHFLCFHSPQVSFLNKKAEG